MKLVAFEGDGRTSIGRLDDDDIVHTLAELSSFYADPAAAMSRDDGDAAVLKALTLRPPVPASARVICIGLNYKAHATEVGLPWPETPIAIGRWAASLSPDGATVEAIEDKFDWEGELAIVIGRTLVDVDEATAMKGILGYAAFNDLSARTYQTLSTQWTLGKNSDGSGPIGHISTADVVGDPADGLRLTTRVNGELVQDSTTSDMIFTVGHIVSFLSKVMTLHPGDVIATGTPSGVGIGRKPPRFLVPGDEVEVAIEKVGKVTTRIAGRAANRVTLPGTSSPS